MRSKDLNNCSSHTDFLPDSKPKGLIILVQAEEKEETEERPNKRKGKKGEKAEPKEEIEEKPKKKGKKKAAVAVKQPKKANEWLGIVDELFQVQ